MGGCFCFCVFRPRNRGHNLAFANATDGLVNVDGFSFYLHVHHPHALVALGLSPAIEFVSQSMTGEVAEGSEVGNPLYFGLDQAVLSPTINKLCMGWRAIDRADNLLCPSKAVGHAFEGKLADGGEHGKGRISDIGMGEDI